jgi:hypothetical protein
MKTTPARLAIATMLLAATYAQSRAEDAVLPAPPATPAASAPAAEANTRPPGGSPPASVPRPSLVPNTTDTASEKPTITAARPYRRHVYRRSQRYAYWEPFPLYLPHVFRRRVHWSRVRWFGL